MVVQRLSNSFVSTRLHFRHWSSSISHGNDGFLGASYSILWSVFTHYFFRVYPHILTSVQVIGISESTPENIRRILVLQSPGEDLKLLESCEMIKIYIDIAALYCFKTGYLYSWFLHLGLMRTDIERLTWAQQNNVTSGSRLIPLSRCNIASPTLLEMIWCHLWSAAVGCCWLWHTTALAQNSVHCMSYNSRRCHFPHILQQQNWLLEAYQFTEKVKKAAANLEKRQKIGRTYTRATSKLLSPWDNS